MRSARARVSNGPPGAAQHVPAVDLGEQRVTPARRAGSVAANHSAKRAKRGSQNARTRGSRAEIADDVLGDRHEAPLRISAGSALGCAA